MTDHDPRPGPPPRAVAGRVVVVDDSEVLLELVVSELEEEGWVVRYATDGETGLRILQEWRPDVCVCDLHMPGVDGIEVLRRCRTVDSTLPVVMLSGDDDLSAVLEAVRGGAFDYVIKASDDLRPLLAAVERAASHARLARENLRLTRALQRGNDELEARLAELDEQHRLLQQEKQRSESLLLNILPKPVAERLKLGEEHIAERYEAVTVLFADIAGFTQLAAKQSPEELVRWLNEVFSRFDRLVESHGAEKIKTIGDAYMAAAGLPKPRPDHARAMAEVALGMLDELRAHNAASGSDFHVRIGLHSGPLIAGVIGTNKFIWDLWGDTVNIASRMQAQGVIDGVQVTEVTWRELGDEYEFEERGSLDIRGRGEMSAWVLKGRKTG